MTTPLLADAECRELADLFDGGRFRSTIEMARYRFGDGRYRYFDHPLPDAIGELRGSFYRHLAPIANAWSGLLGGDEHAFPLEHEELLERCRAAGQERPTPLILRYGEGDWNALHQDLYGDVYFPFQVLTVLSRAAASTTRAASSCCSSSGHGRRAARTSSPAPRGAFVVFPTHHRPQQGARGYYKVGPAPWREHHHVADRGRRSGIIFHDAR